MMNKLKFYGLKHVLRKFDEHGWKGSFKHSAWEIANGGYDQWFVVYYQGEPVVDCIAGELSSAYGLCEPVKNRLLKVIQSVYTHLTIKGFR